MESEKYNAISAGIEKLENRLGANDAKRFGLELAKRIAERLMRNAEKCAECESNLLELSSSISGLNQKQSVLLYADYKPIQRAVQNVTTHLQKAHKQVTKDYYIGVYMSMGLCVGSALGIVFGTTLFNNIGLGLPLGIGFGLALGIAEGAAVDADAKKKGLTF